MSEKMKRYLTIRFGIILLLMLNVELSVSDLIDDYCKSFLPDDYRFFEAPSEDVPIKVYERFEVRDIGEIDEENMDYILHMFVTTIWVDTRIKLMDPPENPRIPTILPKECLKYLWQPDIFFETAKVIEIFKSSAPAIILKVYAEGTVALTIRYLFRSSCQMKFENYPFDSQRCEFFVSLISPDSDAQLHWASERKPRLRDIPAITILRAIEPLQYVLGEVNTHKIVDIIPDANYTSLVAEFVLIRRLVGSVINTYIPSTLIVFMSWFGFWLGLDAVPARVALSITSLLTLCTQAQHYQSQLPPVNYIKAMDIWLFMCIFLVFSTLLEFAVAYNIKKNRISKNNTTEVKPKPERRGRMSCLDQGSNTTIFKKRTNSDTAHNDKIFYFILNSKLISALKPLWMKLQNQSVDELSQILYPSFFIIFACFYWTHYLKIYYAHI